MLSNHDMIVSRFIRLVLDDDPSVLNDETVQLRAAVTQLEQSATNRIVQAVHAKIVQHIAGGAMTDTQIALLTAEVQHRLQTALQDR
jgi:hypothetical protein